MGSNSQVLAPRPWTHNEGRYLRKVLAAERVKFRLIFALLAIGWLGCFFLFVVFLVMVLVEDPILGSFALLLLGLACFLLPYAMRAIWPGCRASLQASLLEPLEGKLTSERFETSEGQETYHGRAKRRCCRTS